MNYTMKDLAKKIGVSRSTISRVINNEPNVNDKTRKKVLSSLKEYGYIPNLIARGLKSELQTIGIIILDISNPYFTEMLYCFDKIAKEYGYSLIHLNSDNNPDIERENIYYLLSMKVKGIIFVANMLDESDEYMKLCINSTNVTAIGNVPSVDCVVPELENSIYEAILYLKNMGHKKIGVCHKGNISKLIMDRIESIKKVMKGLEIPFDEEKSYLGDSYLEQMEDDLNKGDLPTAFIALTDKMALECYEWCKKVGLKIPSQLSIIGFDDISVAKLLNPPLSTIAQPINKLAEKATELLISNIENTDKDQKVFLYLKTTFIERESVAKI